MHAPPPPTGPADDTPADRRWQRAVDASLGGDPLDPGDLAHLALHPGDSPATRRERELLHDLRALALTPDDRDLDAADDALIAATVDRFLAARTPHPIEAARAPRARTATSTADLASAPHPSSTTDADRVSTTPSIISTPDPFSAPPSIAITPDPFSTPPSIIAAPPSIGTTADPSSAPPSIAITTAPLSTPHPITTAADLAAPPPPFTAAGDLTAPSPVDPLRASEPHAAAAPAPTAIDLAAHRSRRRGPLRLRTLALAAAAAAALWLLVIGPTRHVSKDIHDESGALGSPDPIASAPPPTPQPDPRPHLRLLEGDVTADGPPLPAGAPLPLGPLALADRACIGATANLRACADGQVLLNVIGDDALALVALERGHLRVDLAAPLLYRFEVAGVSITSEAPAAFLLIAARDRWELHVERGELRLTDPNGDTRTLGPGQQELHPAAPVDDLTTTSSSGVDDLTTTTTSSSSGSPPDRPALRPRPASDPAALLAEANALRGAGDPRAAAAVYRRLVREHQGTSLARTAQVTLGQLYLGPLADPRAALTAFDAYLRAAPQGALAEEALRGRIDALRRLGRDRPAAEAAAEFLRRFPRSRHADEIRALVD